MRTRVFFLRFREREDTAEIFLTRAEYLPPLNFNREIDEKGRMDLSNRFEYRKTDHNRYLATSHFCFAEKMRSRVEPRV